MIIIAAFGQRMRKVRPGRQLWMDGWTRLAPFDRSAEPVVAHLLAKGVSKYAGEMMLIGPRVEQRFGRRHLIAMTAVFTAPPQFAVLEGRRKIGRMDPVLLTDKVHAPLLLLLAGRS